MIYTQHRTSIKWIEMIVTILLIGILDYTFNLSVSEWAIDPLIFYILLFSLRYGLLGAFVSFTLTSLYHFSFLLMEGADLLLFLYDSKELAWILLHFFVALSAGIFSTSYRERYQSLHIRQEEVVDENAQLKQTVQKLQESQNEMRKRVLDSTYTLSKIYEVGLHLDQDVTGLVRDHLIGTFTRVFKARQIGLYHVDTSRRTLRLHVRSGDVDRLPQTLFIDSDAGMFQRMFQTKRPTLRLADELEGPLLVAPVCYDGDVKEVLVVHEVDILRLRSHEMNMMKLVLDWAGTRIEKADALEWLLVSDQLVDGTRMFRMDAFEQKVEQQVLRHEQYGQPYSTVRLSVEGVDLTLIEMELILRQSMREIDIIGYDEDEQMLHFLLPGTPVESAERFKERIEHVFYVKGGRRL